MLALPRESPEKSLGQEAEREEEPLGQCRGDAKMRPILCRSSALIHRARGMGSEAPVTGSPGSVVFKPQTSCPGVTEACNVTSREGLDGKLIYIR